MNEDTVGRQATLAGGREFGVDGDVDGTVRIGIIDDHHRRRR